jgi:hypothetical protein
VEASRESCSVLAIKGGSSSIRFSRFDESEPLRRLLDGKVDRVGLSGANFTIKDSTGLSQDSRTIDPADHHSAVAFFTGLARNAADVSFDQSRGTLCRNDTLRVSTGTADRSKVRQPSRSLRGG